MVDITKFSEAMEELHSALLTCRRLLLTAPGMADGDSIGSQLALQRMLKHRYPAIEAIILNDEPLPRRYRFLPGSEHVETPETFESKGLSKRFDVAIIVDGGIDRAGRVQSIYDQTPVRVFIDHHVLSCEYPYSIRLVDPIACATTEVIYAMSQTEMFQTPLSQEFCQEIYLGLVFDTGFFRHSNTTPEVVELAAKLMRTGFDFTRVGERGMLERTFGSLQLLSDTLARAKMASGDKVIWSSITQSKLKEFQAADDDREGIIDHLFLTHGIEVAVLFFEFPKSTTKVSLRSHGTVDVAKFARDLTVHGGGHRKAAGANLDMPIGQAVEWVLGRLEKKVNDRLC